MGCDIHAFIEWQDEVDPGDPKTNWWSGWGEMHLRRNYQLFSALTNGKVRGSGGPTGGINPRGIPAELGWRADADFWMRIDYENPDKESSEHTVSPTQALNWGRRPEDFRIKGQTVKHPEGQVVEDVVAKLAGRPTHVRNPDWHTPSWVTPTEFAAALQNHDETAWTADADWHAVSAAMIELEKRGKEVRLVFWFDN